MTKGVRRWAVGCVTIGVIASLAAVTPALASSPAAGSAGRQLLAASPRPVGEQRVGAVQITRMHASGHVTPQRGHSVVPLRVAHPGVFAREKAAANARAAQATPRCCGA